MNVKELLARSRRHMWSLSDSSVIRTHKYLVRKRTLNHLAKLAVFVYKLSGCGLESRCYHLNSCYIALETSLEEFILGKVGHLRPKIKIKIKNLLDSCQILPPPETKSERTNLPSFPQDSPIMISGLNQFVSVRPTKETKSKVSECQKKYQIKPRVWTYFSRNLLGQFRGFLFLISFL